MRHIFSASLKKLVVRQFFICRSCDDGTRPLVCRNLHRGGNRSWNGVIKRLEEARFDYLFVVVGDWRCWFIPASEVDGRSGISLGGPKYSEFEICPYPQLAPRAQLPI
jgi:hypothetical protein